MAILEAIVEETDNILRQAKRYALYLLTEEQEKEYNPSNPTVLLIHGFFFNNIHLQGLQDFLISQGFNTICESYWYWQDLNEIELQIAPEIKEIYYKTGKQISLIGYSAGGLIARSLAQKYPGYINKVITLGAPHQGTLAALLAPFIPGIKQMSPDNDYIKELNRKPIPENVDFYSIYSLHDQAVIPNQNAVIPSTYKNVKNIPLENTGHYGLVGEKMYSLIVEILKE